MKYKGMSHANSVVSGVTGSTFKENPKTEIFGFSESAFTGSASGNSSCFAISGNVGSSRGKSESRFIVGRVGVSYRPSVVSAKSAALYFAQSQGYSDIEALSGAAGVIDCQSSVIATILPRCAGQIEPSYQIKPIDSSYNVLNIESSCYGNPN